ncbi:hypothetical protein, partial [Streptococcus pseudopneumoniae]|uniref:hypothetical protein n=1 Tax=Streptococcus pseudopneumoniae TaxID=257758 RepID=UPI0019D5BDFF
PSNRPFSTYGSELDKWLLIPYLGNVSGQLDYRVRDEGGGLIDQGSIADTGELIQVNLGLDKVAVAIGLTPANVTAASSIDFDFAGGDIYY